jgi:hypothetical protein
MGIRSLKKKQKAAREVQQGTPEPENSTSPGPDDPLANMMFSIGDALDNLKKPAAAAASQPVPIQNGDTTATELRRAQLYASQKSPASPSKPALRSAEVSCCVAKQWSRCCSNPFPHADHAMSLARVFSVYADLEHAIAPASVYNPSCVYTSADTWTV